MDLYKVEEWITKKRLITIIRDFPWEFFKDKDTLTIETFDYTIIIKKKDK